MYCNNKCFVSIYFTAYNKMNSKVLLPGTPTSKIKVRADPLQCLLIEVYNDIHKCTCTNEC